MPVNGIFIMSPPLPVAAQRNLDFYTRVLGPPARQEDRQFRRSRHLSSLFRRRERAVPARSSPSSRGSMRHPGRLGVGETRKRSSACRKRRSAIGRIASSSMALPMRRRRSASARPCLPSRIRTACGWRWSACPASTTNRPGRGGDIPAEYAIRGFHGVSLLLEEAAADRRDPHRCASALPRSAREGSVRRYRRQGHRPSAASSICAQAGGFLPARHGRRLGASHRLPGSDDAAQAAMVAKLAREPWHARHGAEGPQLFPLGLFPRAGRRLVRDRHRYSGLCHR